MNISLNESSAYKIWKGLVFMCDNSPLIQRQIVCNFFAKYLATNSHFASQRGGRTSVPWKSMVKINLTELVVFLTTQRAQLDTIDEHNFHKIWQLMHLDNMTVFFEKIIELIDDAAPVNNYVLASKSVFSALSSIVRPCPSAVLQDFLHYICYFYCGTSPGFLHKHEIILLLQDICRDWSTIFDRIFSFCEVHGWGDVTLELIRTRCPVLPLDGAGTLNAAFSAQTVTREAFCEHMRQRIPPLFCGFKIDIAV